MFLLAAGFGLFLAADVVCSVLLVTDSYQGGLVDLGWLMGYALFGAAALHPAVHRRLRPALDQPGISTPRVLVLGAAALVPLVTAIVEQAGWGHFDPVAPILTSAVMFILMVVRLSGTLHMQRALLEERGVLQRNLEQQAIEDPLTSLLNRRGFVTRVQGAVHQEDCYAAVLFLDIDDFKGVNDSLGHAAGDDVMRTMGRRLRAVVRLPDAVARLGGDEFAILLDNCESPAVAMAFAERIRQSLSAPIEIQGLSLSVTVSIGVAIAAAGTASGDSLIREADLAAYHAKGAGKDRIELFDSDLDRELLRSIAIRNDIRRAVEHGELELRYQPIINLVTGQVESAEALVRWRHPTFGLLLPAEFLHEAEYSGQLVPIGRWVLHEACAEAETWRARGHAVGIHVNVAPVQLAGGSVLADVRSALDASGLPPERLIVEVTESAIDEVDEAGAQFRTLERWGVRLAIDDFGSGYSSLARVEALPVAELKFDRSLTVTNGRLLPALVRLSHSLDLRIIAEGIENATQLERARSLGIDAGQGYLLARPLTAKAFARYLASDEHRAARPALIPAAAV